MSALLTQLLCSAPLFVPGTHTADFSRSDSPNGLSVRGFAQSPTDNHQFKQGGVVVSTVYGWTDPCVRSNENGINPYGSLSAFQQQFWGGYYRYQGVANSRFAVSDIGVGRGSDMLPGPLIGGGPFVDSTGDFGPYGTNFTFQVWFEEWQEWVDQDTYSLPTGVDWPEDGFGNPIWFWPDGTRAVGVTIDAKLGFGGSHVQVTMGIKFDEATGVHTLGVFDNEGDPLTGSNTVNVTSLLSSGDAWQLRAKAKDTGFEVALGINGSYDPAHVAATGIPGYVVERVDAAALRFQGVVNTVMGGVTRIIHVSEIQVTSPDIPTFPTATPDPLPAHAAAELPRLRRDGPTPFFDHSDLPGEQPEVGTAFRMTGVNVPDLLNWFAGLGGTPEYGRHVLDELADKTHHRAVRVYVFDNPGRYVKVNAPTGWNSVWPNSNYPLYDLFVSDPDAYLHAFDEMLEHAAGLGVYIVPSLCPGSEKPLALVSNVEESLLDKDELASVFSASPTTANAVAAQELVQDTITAIVSRYADDPAVLFWEIGNEWDNRVDSSLLGQSGSWELIWDTPEETAAAVGWFADTIRDASYGDDTSHLIGTGFSGSAALFIESPSNPVQTSAAMEDALARQHPESIDLVSWHSYISRNTAPTPITTGWGPVPFPDWKQYHQELAEMARGLFDSTSDVGRPVYYGELDAGRWTTYQVDVWTDFLEEQLAIVEDDPRQGVHIPLIMQWQWMMLPSEAYVDLHNVTPEYLLSPPMTVADCYGTPVSDTRGQVFEAFAKAATGAPVISSSGFGTTFLDAAPSPGTGTAELKAYVHDLQGLAGATIQATVDGSPVTLSASSGSLYTGNVTLPTTVAGVNHLVTFQATDTDGNVSDERPWLQVMIDDNTTTVSPPSSVVHVDNNGVDIPFIQVAGTAGFDPIADDAHTTVDTHRWTVVLYLTNAAGEPLGSGTPNLELFGRINPTGMLPPGAGWTTTTGTLPAFVFADDGEGLDLHAGDGWWVASDVMDASDLSAIALNGEILMELAVLRNGTRLSTIWPRLTVH